MFRPSPDITLLQRAPVRLIAAVLLIVAIAVSALLLFSLEHEAFVLRGVTEGKPVPSEVFWGIGHARHDLVAITVLLFLLSGFGIAALITFQHYAGTRKTLEAVKGLARNILESIPTGVLTVDREGRITAVNPAAVLTLHRETDDLLGRSFEEVFAEGDRMRVALDGALRRRLHLDHHDMSYGADGNVRTIRISTADLAGDDGQPGGVMLLLKDVTELLDLERRVRVADKLAGLHTLSAGVAHELRNPLSALDLNLHLLEEELASRGGLGPNVRAYLGVLNAETRRLSTILDNFMRFAKPGSVHPQPMDTRKLLAHITSLLRYEAAERGIRLTVEQTDALPDLLGDEAYIGQVLVNVLVNAFQAMPAGGLCRIHAAGVSDGGRNMVEIVVQDSGVGIRQEDMARLFEPFYTTKDTGSGLGLAIAYRIVQDHGGTIRVSSAPETGTRVTVSLPAVSATRPAQSVGSTGS